MFSGKRRMSLNIVAEKIIMKIRDSKESPIPSPLIDEKPDRARCIKRPVRRPALSAPPIYLCRNKFFCAPIPHDTKQC
ncbi:hypothetical protein EVAR_100563_1 [Eumeta japonica]|uniref:Uncharacterized protein n=1 Tax=Eumeta variegata TaxID=151549 RepID=A0A4C1YB56_EUMVA|nr:hypothetical protein EVAR_100563_1 [Eumeta japonica]